MGNKPNWGAGLQSLGQSLGQMYERKLQKQEDEDARLRQKKTLEMLRQQSLDDLAASRKYEDERWLAQENIRNPLIPNPAAISFDPNFPRDLLPAQQVRQDDLYKQSQIIQNLREKLATPFEQFVVVGRDGSEQVLNARAGQTASTASSLESAGGYPSPAGRNDQGLPIYRMIPNPITSTAEGALGRNQDKRSNELQIDIDRATRDDFGDVGVTESVRYDPKTGEFNAASFPSMSGGALMNSLESTRVRNPEQVAAWFGSDLADSLDARKIFEPLPGGGMPPGIEQNVFNNIIPNLESAVSPHNILDYADVTEKGWLLDDRGTPSNYGDDQWKKKFGLFTTDRLSVPEFAQQILRPKANDQDEIGFDLFKREFKKAYGIDFSDALKGKTPPPGPGKANAPAGGSTNNSAAPPVAGAVKLSDGNWYIRNAEGKVVLYTGGR